MTNVTEHSIDRSAGGPSAVISLVVGPPGPRVSDSGTGSILGGNPRRSSRQSREGLGMLGRQLSSRGRCRVISQIVVRFLPLFGSGRMKKGSWNRKRQRVGVGLDCLMRWTLGGIERMD